MKIHEIVEFTDSIDITESLNAEFDSLTWETNGSQSIGTGVIDGKTYEIELSPGKIAIGNKIMNYVNVAFAVLLDDGTDTTTFQNSSANSSRVFGAISNAINDELPKIIKANSVDFLIFAAKNDYDSEGDIIKAADRKIRSYAAMVRSSLHGLSNWSAALGELSLRNGGKAIIAMRRKPTSIEWQTIQKYFTNQGKSIDYMNQKK
jgi:hypothetical protein